MKPQELARIPLPSSLAERDSTSLSASVTVKGAIISREDLLVEGEVQGTMDVLGHRVTVAPNGKVTAKIKARAILVLGAIHGDVECSERIEIRQGARLIGDIKAPQIVIEDGAYFKGTVDFTPTEKHLEAGRG